MKLSKRVSLLILFFLITSCFAGLYVPSASCYTGTITYNAGTDTITAIGGNATTPITFNDLYLADVASGWNQILYQGSNQFLLNCKITIGNDNNATYFIDTKKLVTMADLSGQPFFVITGNSYFELGALTNATTKSSKDGVTFVTLESSNSVFTHFSVDDNALAFNLFSCTFINTAGTPGIRGNDLFNNAKIYHCSFYGWAIATASNIDMFDNYFSNYQLNDVLSAAIRSSSGNIFDIKIDSAFYALSLYANYAFLGRDITTKNIYGADIVANAISTNKFLLDCNFESWSFSWSGTNTANVYRQYSFNLAVLNGEVTYQVENANVTLYKGTNYVGSWLTNSSGQIPVQTLTYGYYNQAGGNTIQNATDPFYLTITHPDWATYTSRFYITEKTSMVISMQNQTATPTYNTATFTFIPSNPTINQTVSFDASGSNSTGTITSYSWNFGDNSTATGITASHAYQAIGNYTVTLTTSGTNGTATYQQTINVVNWVAEDESTAMVIVGVMIVVVCIACVVAFFLFSRRDS